MKVATCTICRLENNYITEFVKYYKNIGVDHMYIYDNNVPNTEKISDVLEEYSDFVTVIDYQDQELYPMNGALVEAFNDCFNSHKDEYDWILFLDNDEFLTLVHDDNIKEYLGRECFDNVDAIRVNWLCYDDNNLIYYDNRPMMERFTHPCNDDPYTFDENSRFKTILHTSIVKNANFFHDHAAHCPILEDPILVNNCGTQITDKYSKYTFSLRPINYDLAYYKHYRMKTIDEYVNNKILKLNKYGYDKIIFDLNLFFKYNKYSEEKESAYRKFMKIINNSNKNCVYTVIIGEYDKLRDPTYVTEGWDYICLTDNKNLKSDIWQIIYIDTYKNIFNIQYPHERFWWFRNRDQYINRMLKIKIPSIIYYHYAFSIYADGNVTICGDLNEFKKNYIDTENQDDVYMWALSHASRDCIWDELEACRKQDKDSEFNLKRWEKELNKRNFPHHIGLSQNCILCRYHDGNYFDYIQQEWWNKIKKFSVRDQLSLFFVLYRSKKLNRIKLLFNRNDKKYFIIHNKHK